MPNAHVSIRSPVPRYLCKSLPSPHAVRHLAKARAKLHGNPAKQYFSMDYSRPSQIDDQTYRAVLERYRCNEANQVNRLIEIARLAPHTNRRVESEAARLVQAVRKKNSHGSGIDAFMHEYELSSQEGVVLMCLAEALLRIPDDTTVDRLIDDKIGGSNWESHLGESKSWFVNASTWGLMLTGRILRYEDSPQRNFRKKKNLTKKEE